MKGHKQLWPFCHKCHRGFVRVNSPIQTTFKGQGLNSSLTVILNACEKSI